MSTEITDGPVMRGETDDRAAWTLTPLTEAERPLLMRLVELYLHDLSETTGWDVGDDGRFVETDAYDRYGVDGGHHALLLRVAGRPAGFALVDERSPLPGSKDCRFVAEFFVGRAHRGRGVGSAVARAVFDRFPRPSGAASLPPIPEAATPSGGGPTARSSKNSTPRTRHEFG